jgi:hypothetical protein
VWDINSEKGWKEADGRLLCSYDSETYTNIDQWDTGDVITGDVLTNETDINRGELDAPFVVENASGEVTVGDLTIVIPEGVTATWDSMTGIVKDDATGKIIPVTGTSYGTIPTGDFEYSGKGNLKYKYWYY